MNGKMRHSRILLILLIASLSAVIYQNDVIHPLKREPKISVVGTYSTSNMSFWTVMGKVREQGLPASGKLPPIPITPLLSFPLFLPFPKFLLQVFHSPSLFS